MKLHIDGNINEYYVQTLCMIFYPGEKFTGESTPGAPELYLTLREESSGFFAVARALDKEREASAEKHMNFREDMPRERLRKITVGFAVLGALGELLRYRPAWGMLTGVRPSKVATELLRAGFSRTKVRRLLSSDYLVIPKKAALATDVAIREQQIIGSPSPLDCSVYISIPFCPSRCSYCSFVSYTSKSLLALIPSYMERLCEEIRQTFETIRRLGLCVRTVYIGGGTPTILSEEQLLKLLALIASCTDVSALEEYTLESGRPDTITAGKMAVAVAHGVTRVCVNPQSLCDEVLRGVGRLHTAEDFYRAYSIARDSGIKFINTDLIVGLPGDTFATFSDTYDKILALSPDNITVHTFCVKRAAGILRQGQRPYNLRGGDAGKCVDYSQLRAGELGYLPYYMYRQKNMVGNLENVGFCKEGAQGYYNIYMMEEVHSIFAAGAGAVTKLVEPRTEAGEKKAAIRRLFNHKYPYEYLSDGTAAAKADEIMQFYRERGIGH